MTSAMRILLAAAVLLAVAATATGSKLEECLCYDVATESDCDGSFDHQCRGYIKEVALVAWPSVLGMLLFIMIVPMASVCICFCKCCRYQPGDAPPPQWHRTAFYVTVCVCLIGGAICMGFAVEHSEELTTGVDSMNDLVSDLVKELKDNANAAADSYSTLSLKYPQYAPASVNQTVNDVRNNVTRQADDITDAEDDVLKWDHGDGKWNSRRGLTIAFCALGLIVIILALATGLCMSSWTVYSVVFLVCLFGTMVAITALAYQTVEQVSNDICDDYPTVTNLLLLRANTELGCNAGQTTGMQNLVTAVSDAESAVGEGLYNQLCTDQLFDCTTLNTSWASMSEAVRNPAVIPEDSTDLGTCRSVPGGCTVAACAVNCTANSPIQVASAQANQLDATVQPLFATLDIVVSNWGTCSRLAYFVQDAQTHLCDNIEPHTDKIWISVTFLMVCMLITAMFLLVTAGQRKASATSQYSAVDDIDVYEVPSTQLKTYGTAA
eukprot:TRINITY_DN2865_c0_g1_i1.p1 TRINITY_DN2865_c0_g1~~TRINITY_DN2865_c0_g1_i1.p1  ORF type:complete len:495 (+),score=174.54 TRINITY_DN2865_c0_g1_i1:74-1558(+)